ncbi:hypothetical protein BDZ89DRAFT_1059402 [Hymenopellis radicata]|nr:hypothetical protein BDZ89DRAFT_1059402 [Hymenopellis radicata]
MCFPVTGRPATPQFPSPALRSLRHPASCSSIFSGLYRYPDATEEASIGRAHTSELHIDKLATPHVNSVI